MIVAAVALFIFFRRRKVHSTSAAEHPFESKAELQAEQATPFVPKTELSTDAVKVPPAELNSGLEHPVAELPVNGNR